MDVLSPELALVDEDLAAEARAALPAAPDVLDAVTPRREPEPLRRLRAALEAETVPVRRRRRGPVLRVVAGGLAVGAVAAVTATALARRAPESHQAAPLPAAPPPAVVRPKPVAHRAAHITSTTTTTAARVAPAPKRAPAPVRKLSAPAPRAAAPVARPTPARVIRPRHLVTRSMPPAVARAAPAAATPVHRFPVLSWPAASDAAHYRVGLFHDGDPPTFVCEVWTDDARLALSSVSAPTNRPLTPGRYRWVVYPVYGGDGALGSGDTAATRLAQGSFTL
jgi:hypothetical protein